MSLILAKVVIYVTAYCPYCVHAKNLLDSKSVQYEVINVEHNNDLKIEMLKKSGGRKTVPQIFINDKHLGGYDDLKALNDKGELDKILNIAK